jgi:PTS system galactitol-specific IIA component
MTMQYTLADLLLKDHVLLDLNSQDSDGAIEALVSAMNKTGHVNLTYAQDVIEREKIFPTGLPTEPIPVAIPHSDPGQVLHSAVALAVLDQPVAFGLMGTDGTETVQAKIVILLAIKEQEKQVELLQQLIRVIQTGELLTQLIEAKDSGQTVDILKEYLANG